MAWMRHKEEDEPNMTSKPMGSSPPPPGPAKKTAPPATPRESAGTGKNVNIGPSVHIKGTLAGQEDLTVDGCVEGKISLKEHALTIGSNGRIEAELRAKAVIVYGKVTGNITADHRVEIATSGTVHGDIRAPRVTIADGAMFKGSIDMDGGSATQKGRPEMDKPQASGMPQTTKVAS